jgi:hypothetical protein
VRAVSVEERRGRKVTGVNEGVRGRSDGGGGGGGGGGGSGVSWEVGWSWQTLAGAGALTCSTTIPSTPQSRPPHQNGCSSAYDCSTTT